jgi:hypothetical protein
MIRDWTNAASYVFYTTPSTGLLEVTSRRTCCDDHNGAGFGGEERKSEGNNAGSGV